MDKKQADAVSDALMAEAKAEQSRQAVRAQAKPAKPSWRVVGFGLMGAGIGTAIGAGAGNALVSGSAGFAIGVALGAAAVRRQA